MLDLQALLAQKVAPERPDGQPPEYWPEFRELLALATGRPEQRMGASVIPAVLPQWPEVEDRAAAFLSRTRDLRVALLLVRARLHTGGLAGFFEGVGFIRAMLERHWEALHPAIDEDGDATARVSALAELVDPAAVLTVVRDAEVAGARGVGKVRLRDLGRVSGDGSDKSSLVEPVLAASDPEALARLTEATAAVVTDLGAIEVLVREKTKGRQPFDLSPLSALVQPLAKALAGRARPNGPKPATPGAPGPAVAPPPEDPGLGQVRSRQDVILALDQICAYYERFEPSSPIPLLLRRSKQLVTKSFLDIVRDLVPDAVAKAEAVLGKKE